MNREDLEGLTKPELIDLVLGMQRPDKTSRTSSKPPSTGLAVYLDFADAIKRDGKKTIEAKYGNLFEMYEKIVDDNPYEMPMMIYPAVHYTMGGLWVDYNLMTTIPGLYALGEANFSDHGANRLGASALMQGLADGYFVVPYTLGDYLATIGPADKVSVDNPSFKEAEQNVTTMTERFLSIKGTEPVDSFHKRLGHIMWEYCGMSRNAEGLTKAKAMIQDLRREFWSNVRVMGEGDEMAKPCATMPTSRLYPRGSTKAKISLNCSIKSRSSSRT